MKKSIFHRFAGLFIPSLLLSGIFYGQQNSDPNISEEKQCVLDYLSRPEVVEKFGKISDAIWSYAELGLQEFKSSALLIKTLEEEGFTVEKGLAGMPTCFVAAYGSGKPIIGILAELMYENIKLVGMPEYGKDGWI